MAANSSKASDDAVLVAQNALKANDAAAKSADFLAAQPDPSDAIQQELAKTREWALEARAYAEHAQQTAAAIRNLPQQAVENATVAVAEEAYAAAERRAAEPTASPQVLRTAKKAAAEEPFRQAAKQAQENVALSLAKSQRAAEAVDRLAEESQALAHKAQALQEKGQALPAQHAMIRAHQVMKQSMDMRYWVKKFYKDASDWNDSISPTLQQQQLAGLAAAAAVVPEVHTLPPMP